MKVTYNGTIYYKDRGFFKIIVNIKIMMKVPVYRCSYFFYRQVVEYLRGVIEF